MKKYLSYSLELKIKLTQLGFIEHEDFVNSRSITEIGELLDMSIIELMVTVPQRIAQYNSHTWVTKAMKELYKDSIHLKDLLYANNPFLKLYANNPFLKRIK